MDELCGEERGENLWLGHRCGLTKGQLKGFIEVVYL
jgi:hypothetical protein